MKETVFEQIASFVSTTKYEDLPQEVIKVSKDALIDYVGVTIAGASQNSVKASLAYAKYSSQKEEATIFGHQCKSSVEFAAMVNATASHVLDYDDVSWATIGHPTVVVAPVCFAMAEKYHRTGKEMIHAYALAVEAMHKLADLTMPSVSEKGWHTTPVYGVFGAVIAGALLKGSSKEEIINALGLGASKASGIRANFGTDTKSYHAGMACYNGLEALYLSHFGMCSSSKSFEDMDGFMQTFAGICDENLTLKLAKPWDLIDRGLVFKQYPCCSGSHPAADLIKEMHDKHNFELEEIEHIHVGCSLLAPKELKCDFPNTALEAKFSMRYAVASMLVFGGLGLEEFLDEKVQCTQVQELMSKIDVKVDEEFKKLGFIGTSPAYIKITLSTGEIFSDRSMLAKGNPEKPLSLEEIKQKFFTCTKHLDQGEALFSTLEKMEVLESLEPMLAYCD